MRHSHWLKVFGLILTCSTNIFSNSLNLKDYLVSQIEILKTDPNYYSHYLEKAGKYYALEAAQSKKTADSLAMTSLLFDSLRVSNEETQRLMDSVGSIVIDTQNEVQRKLLIKVKSKIYQKIVRRKIQILLPQIPSYSTNDGLDINSFQAGVFKFNYSNVSTNEGISYSKCKGSVILPDNDRLLAKCVDRKLRFNMNMKKYANSSDNTPSYFLSFSFDFPNDEAAALFDMKLPAIIEGEIYAIQFMGYDSWENETIFVKIKEVEKLQLNN